MEQTIHLNPTGHKETLKRTLFALQIVLLVGYAHLIFGGIVRLADVIAAQLAR
jgi:hypothetical protein